jgi:hypothetical protein
MRSLTSILCLIALAAVLAGCHRHGVRDQPCTAGPHYLNAQSVPPLRTVDGLAAPNTRNALKIPEVTAPLRAHSMREGCLDESPSFFPGRPKPGQKATAPPATPTPPPASTPATAAGPPPEAPK